MGLLLLLIVIAYFAPSLVAYYRHHSSRGAILVINVFLGWTFLGWVVALAWACSGERSTPERARAEQAASIQQPVAKLRESPVAAGAALIAAVVIVIILAVELALETTRPLATKRTSLPAASAQAPATPAAAPYGSWRVEQERSKMDGSLTIVLGLDSTDTIRGWLETAKPSLIVRCLEHKTSIYVVTGMSAQPVEGAYDEYPVQLRFDEGKMETRYWRQSTDSKALGIWSGPNAIALSRRLAKANKLLFRFTPFNASPAVASVDLRGLDWLLPKVAKACGWR